MEVIYGVEDGVTHVSEQLLPISPVYTPLKGEDLISLPWRPVVSTAEPEGS